MKVKTQEYKQKVIKAIKNALRQAKVLSKMISEW